MDKNVLNNLMSMLRRNRVTKTYYSLSLPNAKAEEGRSVVIRLGKTFLDFNLPAILDRKWGV